MVLTGAYPAAESGFVYELEYSSNYSCEWYIDGSFIASVDGDNEKTTPIQVSIEIDEDGMYCLSTQLKPDFGDEDDDLFWARIDPVSGSLYEVPMPLPLDGSLIDGFWDLESSSHCTRGEIIESSDGTIEVVGSDIIYYHDHILGFQRIDRSWSIALIRI